MVREKWRVARRSHSIDRRVVDQRRQLQIVGDVAASLLSGRARAAVANSYKSVHASVIARVLGVGLTVMMTDRMFRSFGVPLP